MASFRSQMTDEVQQRLKKKESFLVLDVREQDEWISGHIHGAKHIPLMDIPERFKELDPKKEIVVVCYSGSRSLQACQYLAHMGFNVVNMMGGMSAWRGDIEYGV